jgi:hypothetical protein
MKKTKKPKQSVVERTAGIFKSDLPPLTAIEMREFAERAIADSAMECMQRSSQAPPESRDKAER